MVVIRMLAMQTMTLVQKPRQSLGLELKIMEMVYTVIPFGGEFVGTNNHRHTKIHIAKFRRQNI